MDEGHARPASAGYCLAMAPAARNDLERDWTGAVTRAPHPGLHEHVRRYWGYGEQTVAPMRRRELPSPEVVVILSSNAELRLLDARDPTGTPARHTSFVAGLTEASVLTEHDGVSHGLQVNLTPLGARAVFGMPMHVISNGVVALEDVWGRAAGELVERLYEASGWPARFDILDAAIADRIARTEAPPPAVAWAWTRLVATHGRIAVAQLTKELGCSRKYLATHFREQIGLPPKPAARVLRFHRAAGLLRREPGAELERVAMDCGYYDQPHFNRDFREFAGSTPGEFLARLLPSEMGVAPE